MEKTIHNVAEIDSADRRAIEHLIGKHLAELWISTSRAPTHP